MKNPYFERLENPDMPTPASDDAAKRRQADLLRVMIDITTMGRTPSTSADHQPDAQELAEFARRDANGARCNL